MNKEQDYIRDLAEIRSMMERSSRFLSLSGWAGIMAGIYALVGAYVAHTFYHFDPANIQQHGKGLPADLEPVVTLATVILVLSVGTAAFLSYRRSLKRKESFWNGTSRRMVNAMAVPLVAGGLLCLVVLSAGPIAWLVPLTLLFYGLSLHSAGNYTFREVQHLGLIQIGLGLLSAWQVEYSLLLWATGFGLMHIVYGIYLYVKYERAA
ncbi:MAG: hypothetical protein MUF29_05590 [Chitinophagaceae bacterium]|nr:hypothetical protein [Chitinophagaceae bacterium]